MHISVNWQVSLCYGHPTLAQCLTLATPHRLCVSPWPPHTTSRYLTLAEECLTSENVLNSPLGTGTIKYSTLENMVLCVAIVSNNRTKDMDRNTTSTSRRHSLMYTIDQTLEWHSGKQSKREKREKRSKRRGREKGWWNEGQWGIKWIKGFRGFLLYLIIFHTLFSALRNLIVLSFFLRTEFDTHTHCSAPLDQIFGFGPKHSFICSQCYCTRAGHKSLWFRLAGVRDLFLVIWMIFMNTSWNSWTSSKFSWCFTFT